MRKGRDGGQLAVKLLNDSVEYHLLHGAPTPCHMWIYMFFSKQILTETLTQTSVFTGELRAARDALDEFVFGFNKASERFTMIDIAQTRE